MSSSIKECKVLQPEYYRTFQCEPTKCLETCCERWRITIDEDTYQKYVESENATIKDIVATGLSQNEKAVGSEDFGIINLNKEMVCPFLNEEGYCEVYINMGESCLSKTCKSYPRAATMINDGIERGLQMSCSVAAELALLNESGMAFERLSETIDFNDTSVVIVDIDDPIRMDINNQTRTMIIEILQNRKVGLSERVSVVGDFLNQIVSDKKFSDLNHKEILGLIDDIKASINNTMFTSEMTVSHDQYKDQFDLLNSILAMKFTESEGLGFTSKRYIECLWQVLDAFEDIDEDDVAEYYKENYERYLKPYLDEKKYILENFLVNYVFIYSSELFQPERVWHFYIKLCTVYGLIKFNLIGLAIDHEGMTDELALKLIQSLSKTILSDSNYLDSVVEYLEDTEVVEISKLNILITN